MIPDFNAQGLLPATAGSDDVGLYETTMTGLIARFGYTPERRRLIEGLLDYRAELYRLGLLDGHQLLGGSFVEDSERTLGRSPRDLDVVTHAAVPGPLQNQPHIAEALERLFDTSAERFKVEGRVHADGYKNPGAVLHDMVKAALLFVRERDDNFIKGIVSIDLDRPGDLKARERLAIFKYEG